MQRKQSVNLRKRVFQILFTQRVQKCEYMIFICYELVKHNLHTHKRICILHSYFSLACERSPNFVAEYPHVNRKRSLMMP